MGPRPTCVLSILVSAESIADTPTYTKLSRKKANRHMQRLAFPFREFCWWQMDSSIVGYQIRVVSFGYIVSRYQKREGRILKYSSF